VHTSDADLSDEILLDWDEELANATKVDLSNDGLTSSSGSREGSFCEREHTVASIGNTTANTKSLVIGDSSGCETERVSSGGNVVPGEMSLETTATPVVDNGARGALVVLVGGTSIGFPGLASVRLSGNEGAVVWRKWRFLGQKTDAISFGNAVLIVWTARVIGGSDGQN